MTAAAAASPGFPRLEKYELLEEIGHGGMATVYRARDVRLGREVAVKIIHRHLRENAEVGTRFVAEARAAAKLRHPGIVEVFDVSSDDDAERYLVVELVRGCTLRKLLLQHREMPAEVGAAIVRQLCEAVEHAHASAIIHRDIKPENVLVELPKDRAGHDGEPWEGPPNPPARGEGAGRGPDRDHGQEESSVDRTPVPSSEGDTQASVRDVPAPQRSRPRSGKPSSRRGTRAKPADPGVVIKITDFGIAKILDAQGVTSTGQVLGSPAHMAPEQIEGGEVDNRTDVFALGVLLYETLVGHLPFEGKNPAQVLRRVLEGAYPAVDRERPAAGNRWGRVVAGALAHDLEGRTASAAQLGEQIDAELAALGITDSRAEIAAYFADPAAYVAAHKARLVPLLSARGEAARKAGDVWGAAADWNRALALAPEDLSLLKRIAGLTSSAGRRVLLRRVAMIVAGSAALGVGAFAVARTLKARSLPDPGPIPGSSAVGSTLPPRAGDTAVEAARTPPRTAVQPDPILSSSAPPPTPAEPAARVTRIAAVPSVILPAAVPSTRAVRFTVKPQGARLIVDGVERAWFRTVMQLSVGAHSIEAIPTHPTCCRKTSSPVVVAPPPADRPDEELNIVFPMELNPAGVLLAAGAPPGAELNCADIGLTVPAGKTVLAKLRDPMWEGQCAFVAPGRPRRFGGVSLRAGENKAIPWPE